MPAKRRIQTPSPRIRLIDYKTPQAYAPEAERLRVLHLKESSQNPCPRCPGHCCRLLLSLTVQDVARICVALSVQPEEFCFLQERHDDWNSPPVDVEGTRMHLMLDSGAMQPGGSTKPCVFLHTMKVQCRCSIYELRPMTCRLYPFRWYEDGVLNGPRVIWCGENWLVDAATERRVVATIRQANAELETSAAVIHAFNRQRRIPHTAAAFLRHAVEQGARLLGLDASEVLQPRTPRRLGQRLW
jgi:Fe-S-cluster containining protein